MLDELDVHLYKFSGNSDCFSHLDSSKGLTNLLLIHYKIQEKNPRIGLLQSSVVTIYSTYLTWSALASEPNSMKCNSFTPFNTEPSSVGGGFSLFLGVFFTFVALVYAAVRAGSSGDDFSTSSVCNFLRYSEHSRPRQRSPNQLRKSFWLQLRNFLSVVMMKLEKTEKGSLNWMKMLMMKA